MSVPQQDTNSIVTQVTPSGLPVSGLLDTWEDSEVTLNARGELFHLTRDELMRLPESILLSLFPSGVFLDINGQMVTDTSKQIVFVNFSSETLDYILKTFRALMAQVSSSAIPDLFDDSDDKSHAGVPRNMQHVLDTRPAVIVLREDLDYYVIPSTKTDYNRSDMLKLKAQCGTLLTNERSIFAGLKRTKTQDSAEQHLIDMLSSSGLSLDEQWAQRSLEPDKAVITSLSLTTLKRHNSSPTGNAASPLAHKLLLFWRKPARKCWWDMREYSTGQTGLDSFGARVHVRRVWTLELSVVGLR